MAKQDFYEVLGVSKGVSPDALKKAYRTKAMQFHPDRNAGDKTAEAKFKDINEAYGVLNDDQKRAAYDRFGHAAFENGGDMRHGFRAAADPFAGYGGFGANGGFDFAKAYAAQDAQRAQRERERAARDRAEKGAAVNINDKIFNEVLASFATDSDKIPEVFKDSYEAAQNPYVLPPYRFHDVIAECMRRGSHNEAASFLKSDGWGGQGRRLKLDRILTDEQNIRCLDLWTKRHEARIARESPAIIEQSVVLRGKLLAIENHLSAKRAEFTALNEESSRTEAIYPAALAFFGDLDNAVANSARYRDQVQQSQEKLARAKQDLAAAKALKKQAPDLIAKPQQIDAAIAAAFPDQVLKRMDIQNYVRNALRGGSTEGAISYLDDTRKLLPKDRLAWVKQGARSLFSRQATEATAKTPADHLAEARAIVADIGPQLAAIEDFSLRWSFLDAPLHEASANRYKEHVAQLTANVATIQKELAENITTHDASLSRKLKSIAGDYNKKREGYVIGDLPELQDLLTANQVGLLQAIEANPGYSPLDSFPRGALLETRWPLSSEAMEAMRRHNDALWDARTRMFRVPYSEDTLNTYMERTASTRGNLENLDPANLDGSRTTLLNAEEFTNAAAARFGINLDSEPKILSPEARGAGRKRTADTHPPRA